MKHRSDFSRREFLGGMLLVPAVFASECATQDRRKLGVALLGLGRYATGELGPALRQTKLCSLKGVITGTPSKGEKWMADYSLDKGNVFNYENMDRIIDNRDIDIVYVVTPPSLHPEFAIRAARAGKHVISEKPMATSVADCNRMIDACKKAKVQLGIGYRLHYDPYHREMERIGKAQEIGRIEKMTGGFGYVLRQREHRIDKKLAGGGPLMDVGIYVVHAACMATGNVPVYVTAKEGPKMNPELFNEVEETISWTMEFPKGEICEGFASFNQGANRFRCEGKSGWLELKSAFSYRGVRGETNRGEMNFPAASQQTAQIDDFADCILSGRQTSVPGELGRRDVSILLAIYEAARTGKRVKVEGVK